MKRFHKLTAWLLGIAILIMLLMSITTYAQESTVVTVGDFTIVATDGETTLSAGKDYTYENGELVISATLPVTVSMREGVTSTTDVMKILTTGGAADITFDNLTINTADDYYAVQLNEYGATSENNPCTIRLVGTNTLENTYTYGHAIRVYGDNTDVNITSTDNGVLNISNTGSNGAVYSEHASDLTINGNAVVSVTAQVQSALNNCGTTTIAENAKVTLLAAKDGIISGNQSDDNVIIKDNADINITVGTGSGIRANNIASISDNAKIIIKGDDSGTSGIRAEKDIKISGYADITMNNTGAYGIRSYGGANS